MAPPAGIQSLSSEEVRALLQLLGYLAGDTALSPMTRLIISDLIDVLVNYHAQLTNAQLDQDNQAIKELTGRFASRKTELKTAHEQMLKQTETMSHIADAIGALGKLIGAVNKDGG